MVSIRSHLAKGRVESILRALRFLNPNLNLNHNLFPQSEIKSKRKITIMIKRKMTSPIVCSIAALCLAAMVARADERDVQFDRWFATQTNLQSWSADFTQTRSLKVLSQPLVATGKVWVTAPGLFRWELGQPAQTIVLRQPNQLLIIYPRLKRAEKYSLEGVPPGPLKDALALMDASLPRDRASMEERFRLLSATETNSILQMTLQPKSASARKFISEIIIGFHTNDFSIAVTELKFADGSGLRNDFTNTVLNQPIDPALFQVKLAPDFTVVEPLRQSPP
jgi:outer membrane lipoprotein-sorting protein